MVSWRTRLGNRIQRLPLSELYMLDSPSSVVRMHEACLLLYVHEVLVLTYIQPVLIIGDVGIVHVKTETGPLQLLLH